MDDDAKVLERRGNALVSIRFDGYISMYSDDLCLANEVRSSSSNVPITPPETAYRMIACKGRCSRLQKAQEKLTPGNVAQELNPVELPTARTTPLDPAPELNALREQQPLCRLRYPGGHIGWLVTSYDLARQVLVDPRFTVHKAGYRPPAGNPDAGTDFADYFSNIPERAGMLAGLDPPQHNRMRRAMAGYFSVRSVSGLRANIEQIVEERLDALAMSEKPVDLVDVFALPVASMTICALLGGAPGDREHFERPSAVISDPHASTEERTEAVQQFLAFCRALIERKRAEPGSDILSDLIARDELTEDELVGIAMHLFEAGHETTASMISLGTLALLEHRERWDLLRANPSDVETTVEELLRYLTIIQLGAFTRTAREDIDIAGFTIKDGESVTVSLAAANRDPKQFSDPEHLRMFEDASGHLAFGHGRHMCIGQHLARLELAIAFRGLMERFPTLCLAVPAAEVPLYPDDNFFYAVHELLVTWEEDN